MRDACVSAASVTHVPLETRAGATRDTPPYLSALEERERERRGGRKTKQAFSSLLPKASRRGGEFGRVANSYAKLTNFAHLLQTPF